MCNDLRNKALLSFEINKILDPSDIAPTLVATDVSRLAVPDGNGLRRLTIREGLRLFGYPEWYEIPTKEYDAFDLLGNTVAVPVVEFVVSRIVETIKSSDSIHSTLHQEHEVCAD
jgi:DNA (cytosine-5)-methyltransferase 1